MKIRKLLTKKSNAAVVNILPTTTLMETAEKLIKFRTGALVVCDTDRQMLGIVSERDLLPLVAGHADYATDTPVSQVMTKSVITCGPDDEVDNIMRLMNTEAIRHMPVLENGRFVHMMNIRELTRAYEMLQREADTDPLTELAGRRPFLKTLAIEFARARRFGHPMAVAMIDIDHFKRVNDTYGHHAGDEVLRALSGILVKEFRKIDLVGRLGGEEFAVVFPETTPEKAQRACGRLLRAVQSAAVQVDGKVIKITISIGLAGILPNAEEGSEILKRADEHLYIAKREGRNRLVMAAREPLGVGE